MSSKRFMQIENALALVLELAEQNRLSIRETRQEPQLFEEYKRQLLACSVVHDFIVNNCEFPGDET